MGLNWQHNPKHSLTCNEAIMHLHAKHKYRALITQTLMMIGYHQGKVMQGKAQDIVLKIFSKSVR